MSDIVFEIEGLATSPRWETKPYGVVSLLEVLLFAANDFCWVLNKLTGLYCVAEGKSLSPGAYCEALAAVDQAENFSKKFDLQSSKDQIIRIRSGHYLSVNASMSDLKPLIGELIRRLQEDLAKRTFLHVSPAKMSYLADEAPEIEPLESSFPGAYKELVLARQCFALEQEMACVFHSMRGLEIGLTTLANHIDSEPQKPEWHQIITAIENKIKDLRNSSLPPSEKERLRFLSDAATNFRHFKDAWRNHIMHVREKYGEREAKKIMDSVEDFMLCLSKRGLASQV